MKSTPRSTVWPVTIGLTLSALIVASVKLYQSRSFVAALIDTVKVNRLPGPHPWLPDESPDSPQTARWAAAPLLTMAVRNSPLPAPPTPAQLLPLFPQFKHQPFQSAGFCPLMLPFRYNDPQKLGDISEANAFSFLLSDALDWAPGNYCRQHAYFIFKRSRNLMLPLRTQYFPGTINWLVNHWTATHAVGGSITRHADGCTGTLEIYDHVGNPVFAKSYPKPRPYFDLLGDMSVDALTFFGAPPNAALAQHLHLPRCKKTESIIRLGLAAFAPEKTAAEFDQYAAILREDPDFAEVRYWWANQRAWKTGNDQNELQRQTALAMQSRLTVSALSAFSPTECRDRELAHQFPAWVDHAQQLLGPGAPLLLRIQLADANRHHRWDPQLIRQALTTSAKYPNDAMLLTELARALGGGCEDGPVDDDTAASLVATVLSSRFVPVTGNVTDARDLLAWPLQQLGRPELAATLMDVTLRHDTWELHNALTTLNQAGRFAQTITLFKSHRFIPNDPDGITAAMEAAIAAATLDDAASLADIEDRFSNEFAFAGFSPILSAYQDALAGRPVDSNALRQACLARASDQTYRQCLLMAAQTDLILRRRHMLDLVWAYAAMQPSDRLFWGLLDAYERQEPTAQATAFYDCLAWQYPNDAWVTRAASDANSRRTSADQDRQTLSTLKAPRRDILTTYAPTDCPARQQSDDIPARLINTIASPWVAAALVHDLLTQHQTTQAHDLALRYQNLAVQTGRPTLRAWAGHLVALTNT